MIYFGIFCFLLVSSSALNCQVSACLKCENNNPKKCEYCHPALQNLNGQCLFLLKSTTTPSIKQQDVLLDDDTNIKNETLNNQNDTSSPINSSITKKVNPSISYTLDFSSMGNNQTTSNPCLYQTQFFCLMCNDGYTMRPGGICVIKIKKCMKFNFRVNDGGAQCQKCDPGFKLINKTCVDMGCQQTSYYACQKCKVNYNMTVQGHCYDPQCLNVSNGQCSSCNSGLFISSSGKCTKINPLTNTTTNSIQNIDIIPNNNNTILPNNTVTLNNTITSDNTVTPNNTVPITPPANSTNTSNNINNTQINNNSSVVTINNTQINNTTTTNNNITNNNTTNTTNTNKTNNTTKNNTTTNNNIINIVNNTTNNTTTNNTTNNTINNNTTNNTNSTNNININTNNNIINIANNTTNNTTTNNTTNSTINNNTTNTNINTNNININTNNTIQPIVTLPPNCLTILSSQCNQCIVGFYLANNTDGSITCKKVSRFCSSFNITTNICSQCANGTTIISNTCIDSYCQSYYPLQNLSDDLSCQKCRIGYYLNSDIGNICSVIYEDSNCLNVHINICLECKSGYFIDTKGHCKKLPEHCYDQKCLYCQQDYVSVNNTCVKLQNCSRVKNSICQICAEGYKLTLIGTCHQKILFCLEYSHFGCTLCAINSILTKDKNCQIDKNYEDPFCGSKRSGQCVKCSSSYYLNQETFLCQPVSRLCAKYQQSNGHCTQCFEGFVLNNISGECIQKRSIPNCAKSVGNICELCANRYYLVNGVQCKEVDKLCDTYDNTFGLCLTCFSGYRILNGKCILASQFQDIKKQPTNQNSSNSSTIEPQTARSEDIINLQKIQSIYCKKIDPNDSTKCLDCFNTFFLNQTINQCTRVNPVCKTHNITNGQCASCYNGYELITAENGTRTCSPFDLQRYSTNFPSLSLPEYSICQKRNETTNQCIQCPPRYYKGVKNICIEVLPECKEFNSLTGQCLQCFDPYQVSSQSNKICQLAIARLQIPYCEQYKQLDGLLKLNCVNCLYGFYLENNSCKSVSILCAQYDSQTGECSECISGYFLVPGQEVNDYHYCVQPALGIDQNCQKYGRNGFCETCKEEYELLNLICTLKSQGKRI